MKVVNLGRILTTLSFLLVFFSPTDLRAETVGVWNGFLNQVNVIEITNPSSGTVNVNIDIVSNSLRKLGMRNFNLKPKEARHIDLSEFPITNDYGIYKVTNSANIDLPAQTTFYRYTQSSEVEFAYAIPVSKGHKGESYGTFNSIDPSLSGAPVSNFLSIVNNSQLLFSANVEVYNQLGRKIRGADFQITNLIPGQRRDFPLGHQSGQVVGMYRILPDSRSSNSAYLAFNTRYSSKPGGGFRFAFPLQASKGSCDSGAVPASTMDPASNWAEVANPTRLAVPFRFEIRDQAGRIRFRRDEVLAPFSQTHFNVNQYLGERNVGSLQASCLTGNGKLLVSSLYYGRKSFYAPEVAWAYASQAKTFEISGDVNGVTLVNRFYNASNWLKIFSNSAGANYNLALYRNAGSKLNQSFYNLVPDSSRDIPLHGNGLRVFSENTIGSAIQVGKYTDAFTRTELLRVFTGKDGKISTIMNVPMFFVEPDSSILDTNSGDNYPACRFTASDPDGDGFGWENNGTCVVTSSTGGVDGNTNNPGTTGPICVDSDGDGWGWDGVKSCRVGDNGSSGDGSSGNYPTCSSSVVDYDGDGFGFENGESCEIDDTPPTTGGALGSPVATHGKLSVCKKNGFYSLCDQFGRQTQLRGMSSHGIQWSGWNTFDSSGCLTEKSFDLLADTWRTDVFRIAMYVDNGGYRTNPERFIQHVNKIIAEASERGMYVIVDFHILSNSSMGISGNPLHYLNEAKTFFRRIVEDNRDRNNVIYEVANEPQGSTLTWGQIKSYGDQLVSEIRRYENPNNPAVIIVGTNSWSSFGMANGGSFMDIVNNPVVDSKNNTMYAFHFYANDPSHKRNGYKDALNESANHIPVFVTEWGTTHASGDGNNDFGEAQEYVDIMKNKKISWAMWNFSDTDEQSAVWASSSFCGRDSGWTNTANLSPAGRYIKNVFDSN